MLINNQFFKLYWIIWNCLVRIICNIYVDWNWINKLNNLSDEKNEEIEN